MGKREAQERRGTIEDRTTWESMKQNNAVMQRQLPEQSILVGFP